MELLDLYLTSAELEGKSHNTLSAYRARIERFLASGIEDVRAVGRADVQRFMATLKAEGLTNASIGAYIVALRSWGQWLEAELWEENWRNVFATFRLPKVGSHIPQVLDKADCERMIAHMPTRTSTAKRDRAVVQFVYATGLRASEVCAVDLADIDLAQRVVFVRNGKGGKDRYSFLTPDAVNALSVWLAVRTDFARADSPALWIGSGSARLTRRQIGEIVHRAAKRVGIDASPHTLRRSRATHLRNAGVPVDVIQEVLGHLDASTTEKAYLNADPLRIRDLAEAALGGMR
jgi:site-specific recombinase XerD